MTTRLFLLSILFLTSVSLRAREMPVPIAVYNFNNGKAKDEQNNREAKLVNAKFDEDRFGNQNNALFLFGNDDSYANLGNYKQIKPSEGSVSLWFRIESVVYSGRGIPINPIISTRNCDCGDYNEAYALYFTTDRSYVEVVLSQDSLKQVLAKSDEIEVLRWYHVVFTYDYHETNMYVNGELSTHFKKDYPTLFNPLDSVMLGVINNKQNRRVLRGSVDDLMFFDKVLTIQEVQQLFLAPNPNKHAILIKRVIWALAIVSSIILIYLFIRYRFKLRLKKERRFLELGNKQLENELRINRALMNPHFVFNAMNTLQHYILTNNNEQASDYVIKFSRLLRKILDSNMSDTISLDQEIELIDLYLEIESLRFKEQFRHVIIKDPEMIASATVIPIMMLQPFIENSIWHGLREKSGDKLITISFTLKSPFYLECIIEDNGTGRKTKPLNPLAKKSMATNFVIQRLALLNKIHKINCSLEITDKENNQGTVVKIVLPILNKIP